MVAFFVRQGSCVLSFLLSLVFQIGSTLYHIVFLSHSASCDLWCKYFPVIQLHSYSTRYLSVLKQNALWALPKKSSYYSPFSISPSLQIERELEEKQLQSIMEENNKKILEAQRRLVSEWATCNCFSFPCFFLVVYISDCVLSGLVSALCLVGAFAALIAFQHAQ